MITPDLSIAADHLNDLEQEVEELRILVNQQQWALAEAKTDSDNRQRQIDAMRRANGALQDKTSVSDMLRETLSLAIQVLNGAAGSILIHSERDDTLVFRHVIGPIAHRLINQHIPISGIPGEVFRTGRSVLVPAVEEDSEQRQLEHVVGYRVESAISVPLRRVDGTIFGTMQVVNSRGSFHKADLEVLEVLSTSAASAMEQARLAEVERRVEIVSVIGDISHDIKNMLTPIYTGASTLQMLMERLSETWHIGEGSPDNEQHADCAKAFEDLRSNADWILNGALEASEAIQVRTKEIADAIKGELAPPFFQTGLLNQSARDVARNLRAVAEKLGVHLTLQLDEELPCTEFDRKLIYNALYNLMDNALSATPKGGRVTLRTSFVDNEQVKIEVVDTGRGMPEHVRARLFTDSQVSTKPGGTGLGTRIAATVVKRHHGTISVASEEGKGTTFTLFFPIQIPRDIDQFGPRATPVTHNH